MLGSPIAHSRSRSRTAGRLPGVGALIGLPYRRIEYGAAETRQWSSGFRTRVGQSVSVTMPGSRLRFADGTARADLVSSANT